MSHHNSFRRRSGRRLDDQPPAVRSDAGGVTATGSGAKTLTPSDYSLHATPPPGPFGADDAVSIVSRALHDAFTGGQDSSRSVSPFRGPTAADRGAVGDHRDVIKTRSDQGDSRVRLRQGQGPDAVDPGSARALISGLLSPGDPTADAGRAEAVADSPAADPRHLSSGPEGTGPLLTGGSFGPDRSGQQPGRPGASGVAVGPTPGVGPARPDSVIPGAVPDAGFGELLSPERPTPATGRWPVEGSSQSAPAVEGGGEPGRFAGDRVGDDAPLPGPFADQLQAANGPSAFGGGPGVGATPPAEPDYAVAAPNAFSPLLGGATPTGPDLGGDPTVGSGASDGSLPRGAGLNPFGRSNATPADQAGGAAADLSRTNELLQQLLDEVRKGRQPFLPVGDRNNTPSGY